MDEKKYRIRRSRHDDLRKLATIERRAASLFAGTPDSFLCDAPSLVLELVELQHLAGAVWLAVDLDDQPVGFAVAGESEGSGYLHELDVDPLHGRRGLGRRLIETVCEWAGIEFVLLTNICSSGDWLCHDSQATRPYDKKEHP